MAILWLRYTVRNEGSTANRQQERRVKGTIKIPSIVIAHTLLSITEAYMRAGVGIDVINYVAKYVAKMKAKFFFSDQIKFNGHVLKQE